MPGPRLNRRNYRDLPILFAEVILAYIVWMFRGTRADRRKKRRESYKAR